MRKRHSVLGNAAFAHWSALVHRGYKEVIAPSRINYLVSLGLFLETYISYGSCGGGWVFYVRFPVNLLFFVAFLIRVNVPPGPLDFRVGNVPGLSHLVVIPIAFVHCLFPCDRVVKSSRASTTSVHAQVNAHRRT